MNYDLYSVPNNQLSADQLVEKKTILKRQLIKQEEMTEKHIRAVLMCETAEHVYRQQISRVNEALDLLVK